MQIERSRGWLGGVVMGGLLAAAACSGGGDPGVVNTIDAAATVDAAASDAGDFPPLGQLILLEANDSPSEFVDIGQLYAATSGTPHDVNWGHTDSTRFNGSTCRFDTTHGTEPRLAWGEMPQLICGSFAQLDSDRAVASYSSVTAAVQVGVLALFSRSTAITTWWTYSSMLEPVAIQVIPDGFVLTGSMFMRQLDSSGAVVRTVALPRPGYGALAWPVVAHPQTLTLLTGETLDFDTGAVLSASVPQPFVTAQPFLGPGGIWWTGDVSTPSGTTLAVLPANSVVVTPLPAGLGVPIQDAQGRVLFAGIGADRRSIDVYRVAPALFDGVHGASRLDPNFGPGGRLTFPFAATCPLPLSMYPPCRDSDRVVSRVSTAIDGSGLLVLLASVTRPMLWPQSYISWNETP
jgi:hypothetical protein